MTGARDLAAIVAENQIFFARSKAVRQGSERLTFSPHTAVTRLIQGVYVLEPQNARKLLRHRILVSAPPTPLEKAMIRVAAKRFEVRRREELEYVLQATSASSVIEVPDVTIPEAALRSASDLVELRLTQSGDLLRELLLSATRTEGSAPTEPRPRYTQDRKVAAILIGADGRPLLGALNQNARFRTFHAELNLIYAWHKKHGTFLPPGSQIHVTLKPCKMCAALIVESYSKPEEISVTYLENDPGPFAQNTELDSIPGALTQAPF
jgi:tRNA(Arg) A34 adenosine deaminase TadA